MRLTTRLVAAAGLTYPILTIIGFAAFPEPPGGDVSAAHDPSWLAAHTGAVIAQAYVRSFAALGFLLLAVALSAWVQPFAARLVVAGGAGMSLLLLISQALVLSAAFGVRDGAGDGSIRLLDDLHASVLDLSSLPAVVMFAAAAASLLATASGPRWLAWITALGAPLAVLDALSYDGGPLEAVGIVGLAFFLTWSLLAAGALITYHRDQPGMRSAADPAHPSRSLPVRFRRRSAGRT